MNPKEEEEAVDEWMLVREGGDVAVDEGILREEMLQGVREELLRGASKEMLRAQCVEMVEAVEQIRDDLHQVDHHFLGSVKAGSWSSRSGPDGPS